jgi:capsular polysaccharide biosynthesis protein
VYGVQTKGGVMRNLALGIVVGIALGIAILFSAQYMVKLNARVTGIEKFLNQVIQNQQAQRPAVTPAK